MTGVLDRTLDALLERPPLLTADALPPQTLRRGERLVADTIAVALAGARLPQYEALLAARTEPAGDRAPNVIAPGRRWAPAPLAAFLNGTAAVALELDESLVGGGHPGAHVVPAALAEAQRLGRSGEQLVAAALSGYEVAGRLYRAQRMRHPLHPHGLLGGIGAAVAVAQLRGADAAAAARAAATLPLVPSWEACFEGAGARNAWTGAAALLAVLACDLAEAGLHGASAAPGELLAAIAEPADLAALAAPLDPAAPLVTQSQTRVHAAAGPLHTAIEAARELRPHVAGRDVEAVVVETVERNRKFDRLPHNCLAARFSLPHAVAAALTADALTPAAFGLQPDALALAERVEVVVAPDLEARWPARTAARVTLHVDGASHVASCDVPRGHPERPLDEAAFAQRLAALAGAEGAAALDALASRPDVADLLGGLR